MIKSWIKSHLSFKLASITAVILSALILSCFTALMLFIPNDVVSTSLRSGLIVFGILTVALQTFLVLTVSHYLVVEPVRKLIHAIQRIRDGKFNEKCPIESEDEFGELAGSVNQMLGNIQEMNAGRKLIEQKLIKAEESIKFKKELEDKAKIIERMNHELTGAFNDVSLLYVVSQFLNSILDVDDLVRCVEKIFTEKFSCQSFMFYFFDAKSGVARLAAEHGSEMVRANLGREFTELKGCAGQSLQRKKSCYFDDLETSANVERADIENDLTGSVFVVPLIVRDEIVGLLLIERRIRHGFSVTERQTLDSIASQISVAYDRSQLYSKTREMSVRDELTGVFNRRHFQNVLKLEIKRAQRFNRQVSLLMVDMDFFKQFNDKHGHLKGDELLKRLTDLLVGNVREVDLVARFGGEEFVIVLPNTPMSDAVGVANKLRKIIKAQLKSSFPELQVDRVGRDNDLTVSIGVSNFPDCASSATDLIYTADMALYKAKKDGRDLVRTYQSDLLPIEELMA